MKIAIASPLFYPSVGGVEQYTLGLFSRLAKQYGHSITVIALNTHGSSEREEIEGLSIIRIKSFPPCFNPLFSPREARMRLEEIGIDSFDVIITQCRYYFFTAFMALYCARRALHHIHIEHNAGHMPHRSPFISLLSLLYDISVGRAVLHAPRGMIYVSRDVEQFCNKRFGVHMPYCVAPYSVDMHEPMQKKQPDLDSKVLIVYVGRLIRQKGIFRLLTAYRDAKLAHTQLIIVGDGPERAAVNRMISRYNLRTVRLLEEIPMCEIDALLDRADIFVNPTYYPEGFQISLLQAAHKGCAIISTDAPGVRELLDNGRCGMIVPHRALRIALERLARDASFRSVFSRRVRAFTADRFSWDSTLSRVQEFLLSYASQKS
ncbi:glycosyltransferase family 4 protein [Candidatus Uhrbacteria bacterium]|nr:glycosyltransferase family 4 protein [Candidatus Uhrbacteria bacterium]